MLQAQQLIRCSSAIRSYRIASIGAIETRAIHKTPQNDYDTAKFYASLYPEDERYQEIYKRETFKESPSSEVLDRYLEKAETFANNLRPPPPVITPYYALKGLFLVLFISFFISRLLYNLDPTGTAERRKRLRSYIKETRKRASGLVDSDLSRASSGIHQMVPAPDTKFDDVKGIDEVTEELRTIVKFLNHPKEFADMGAKIPRGILLFGPPGTGKTLLARAIAGEAGVPIFIANASSFEDKYVGVGSKRIKKLFKDAKKNAPCIVFIDELDGLAKKREKSYLHTNNPINQLLAELDGFEEHDGIVFIAATNVKESLDNAILRPGRIDKLINVPLPSRKGREEILNFFLSKVKTEEGIDISKLVDGTIQFSGAQLENLVNQAAITAISEGCEEVTIKHLESSFTDSVVGTKRPLTMDDKQKELTAIHEGGHAIVAFYTPGSGAVYQATILPRGGSLGHITQIPVGDHPELRTRAQLFASLDVAYGGRIAEEIAFGVDNTSTGCSSDFEYCRQIADVIVFNGLSDLGFVTTSSKRKENVSPSVKKKIDDEIARIMEESRVRVTALLLKHKKEHKLLVDALLKHETLNNAEVTELLATGKISFPIPSEENFCKKE